MLRIGHRGAPGCPRFGENTLLSFDKAISLDANAIELDVRRSKDGKLVVIHDSTIDRTTNGHGKVSELTYAELLEFNAGYGEHIPLLEAVLNKIGSLGCIINIELKESGLIDEVARLVLDSRSPAIISAFDTDDNDEDSSSSWQELEMWSKKVPTALLATRTKIKKLGAGRFIEIAKEVGARAINTHKTAIFTMPGFVRRAHDNGLTVNVWTVNSRLEVRILKFLGVDGIFSDRPEIL